MRARAQNELPITSAQIKKIHVLKHSLAMDDDTYRQILQNCFKLESSKELNRLQAGDLIEVLEKHATECGVWEQRTGKPNPMDHLGERPGMASPTQLKKIQAQWKTVSRSQKAEDRTKALRHFIERVAKVSDLRFLDAAGAGKVLNALKSMQARKPEAKKSKPTDTAE